MLTNFAKLRSLQFLGICGLIASIVAGIFSLGVILAQGPALWLKIFSGIPLLEIFILLTIYIRLYLKQRDRSG
jgi:hypothetical protein